MFSHENHCRSNRSLETIYKIVFYAGVSPALKVQKSVMFLHSINVLTNHNRTLTRYIWYQGCSKMTGVMVYDKEYSCLSKLWSHACMWQFTILLRIEYLSSGVSYGRIPWRGIPRFWVGYGFSLCAAPSW